MQSNPQKFNPDRTDEIAREAFCKAAQYGTKIIDEAVSSAEGRMIVNFDERLSALGVFMGACTDAMLMPARDDDREDDEI